MSQPSLFDFSNGARFTVTICNDRAITNIQDGGDFEFQHTWLILTDNTDPNNPVQYVLSFTSKDSGPILEEVNSEWMTGTAEWEDPEDPSYIRLLDPQFRTTEAFTMAVEDEEAFYRVISEDYKTDFLNEHETWSLFGENDKAGDVGINCTVASNLILNALGIRAFDSATTPTAVAGSIYFLAYSIMSGGEADFSEPSLNWDVVQALNKKLMLGGLGMFGAEFLEGRFAEFYDRVYSQEYTDLQEYEAHMQYVSNFIDTLVNGLEAKTAELGLDFDRTDTQDSLGWSAWKTKIFQYGREALLNDTIEDLSAIRSYMVDTVIDFFAEVHQQKLNFQSFLKSIEPSLANNIFNLGVLSRDGEGRWLINDGEQATVTIGRAGDDELSGTGAFDVILGGAGADTLDGGAGRNNLYGGEGDDTYVIGAGQDTVEDSDGLGRLVYGPTGLVLGSPTSREGNSYKFESNGQSFTYLFQSAPGTSSGGDLGTLTILDSRGLVVATVKNFNNGNLGITLSDGAIAPDVRTFGSGIDSVDLYVAGNIDTGAGYDWVTGSKFADRILLGNDSLDVALGNGGNDYIEGQGGMDFIMGGAKADNPAFQDNDVIIGGAGSDILQGGAGHDLIYTDTPAASDPRDSTEKGDWATGGIGNDEIHGSGQRDFLHGGSGNDIVHGRDGDDIILGDGNYDTGYRFKTLPTNGTAWTINENGESRFTMSPSTILDSAVFQWTANTVDVGNGLTDFTFTKQTGTVNHAASRLAQDGDSYNDYIDGGSGSDWIAGQLGNDFILGGDGDDTIYGDDLNASPNYAYYGDNDTLIGGQGSDKVYGGEGDDVMYSDVLLSPYPQSGAGMNIGDGAMDEMWGGSGNDVMYAGTGGDKLYGEGGNDTLVAGFASNAELSGGYADDTLVIGYGQDNTFAGGLHLDSYVMTTETLKNSSGWDTINDEDGLWKLIVNSQEITTLYSVGANKWGFGDFEIRRAGNDLILYTVEAGADGTVEQVGKQVRIVNGANQQGFTAIKKYYHTLPESEPEPNSPPEISGSIGNYEGKAGEAFSFTLPASLFSDPDGDPLKFRLTLANGSALPDWMVFNQNTMTVSGAAPDAFDQVLRLTASDGRGGVVSTDFSLTISPQTYHPMNHAPEISGSPDDYEGKAGEAFSFTIPASLFSDPDGDPLSFRLTLADGSDLPEWLTFDPATLTVSGTAPGAFEQALKVTVSDGRGGEASTDFNITVVAESTPDLTQVIGSDDDNELLGTNGDDYIQGLGGADHMEGGEGNDVYVFGPGYGHDVVNTWDSSGSSRDVLRLEGLNPADVTFGMLRDAENRQQLLITVNATGETLTVLRGADAGDVRDIVEAFEFADGTVWEWADVLANGLHGTAADDEMWNGQDLEATYFGGAGNDVMYASSGRSNFFGEAGDDELYGGTSDDRLEGGDGHDALFGGGGHDSLVGSAGDDTLIANEGHDTLRGGTGQDWLEGGAGDDRYIFSAGDGTDYIKNTEGGSDTLMFEDVNPSELWFGRAGDDLAIRLIGSQDAVYVCQWFSDGDYKIDSIEAGGLAVTENQVALMIQAMASVGAPGGVDGQWTDEQREALAPVLASYWQPKV